MIPGEYPISFFLTTRHCTGQGVHRSLGVHLIRCSLLIWQGTRCTAGGQHLILGSGFLISFVVFSLDKTGQGTRCRVHTWLKGSTWSFSWSAVRLLPGVHLDTWSIKTDWKKAGGAIILPIYTIYYLFYYKRVLIESILVKICECPWMKFVCLNKMYTYSRTWYMVFPPPPSLVCTEWRQIYVMSNIDVWYQYQIYVLLPLPLL